MKNITDILFISL